MFSVLKVRPRFRVLRLVCVAPYDLNNVLSQGRGLHVSYISHGSLISYYIQKKKKIRFREGFTITNVSESNFHGEHKISPLQVMIIPFQPYMLTIWLGALTSRDYLSNSTCAVPTENSPSLAMCSCELQFVGH